MNVKRHLLFHIDVKYHASERHANKIDYQFTCVSFLHKQKKLYELKLEKKYYLCLNNHHGCMR